MDQVQGTTSPPRGSYSRLVGAATARADWLRAFASRQNRQVGSTLCLAVGSSLSTQRPMTSRSDGLYSRISVLYSTSRSLKVCKVQGCGPCDEWARPVWAPTVEAILIGQYQQLRQMLRCTVQMLSKIGKIVQRLLTFGAF